MESAESEVPFCCRTFFTRGGKLLEAESKILEYKNYIFPYDTIREHQLKKAICGMRNTDGGIILVGIKETEKREREVVGAIYDEELKENFNTYFRMLTECIEPPHLISSGIDVNFVPLKEKDSEKFVLGCYLVRISILPGNPNEICFFTQSTEDFYYFRTTNETIRYQTKKVFQLLKEGAIEAKRPKGKPFHHENCLPSALGKPLFNPKEGCLKQVFPFFGKQKVPDRATHKSSERRNNIRIIDEGKQGQQFNNIDQDQDNHNSVEPGGYERQQDPIDKGVGITNHKNRINPYKIDTSEEAPKTRKFTPQKQQNSKFKATTYDSNHGQKNNNFQPNSFHQPGNSQPSHSNRIGPYSVPQQHYAETRPYTENTSNRNTFEALKTKPHPKQFEDGGYSPFDVYVLINVSEEELMASKLIPPKNPDLRAHYPLKGSNLGVIRVLKSRLFDRKDMQTRFQQRQREKKVLLISASHNLTFKDTPTDWETAKNSVIGVMRQLTPTPPDAMFNEYEKTMWFHDKELAAFVFIHLSSMSIRPKFKN